MLNFQGSAVFTSGALFLIIATFCAVLGVQYHSSVLPDYAAYCTLGWLLLAGVAAGIGLRYFVVGFLFSVFSLLISWRIVALYNIVVFEWLFVLIFACMLLNFARCVMNNIKNPELCLHAVSYSGWQLTFIRIYIGLDFIPHFTEKLFAGPMASASDVQAFSALGIPHPELVVLLAGLCEFAAAFSLSMGFMTRLGSLGAALYLLIATYLGHHFSLGFIWVNHGGGWEFAVMWTLLVLSYAFSNARDFSYDQWLSDKFVIPAALKKLM